MKYILFSLFFIISALRAQEPQILFFNNDLLNIHENSPLKISRDFYKEFQAQQKHQEEMSRYYIQMNLALYQAKPIDPIACKTIADQQKKLSDENEKYGQAINAKWKAIISLVMAIAKSIMVQRNAIAVLPTEVYLNVPFPVDPKADITDDIVWIINSQIS